MFTNFVSTYIIPRSGFGETVTTRNVGKLHNYGTAAIIEGGDSAVIRVCAVSYTHLDVYKRQFPYTKQPLHKTTWLHIKKIPVQNNTTASFYHTNNLNLYYFNESVIRKWSIPWDSCRHKNI